MRVATAESWYETRGLGEGVTLIRQPHILPFYRCNIWHVRGRDRDLLLDSGMGVVPLRRQVALLAERPILAIASHGRISTISAPIINSPSAPSIGWRPSILAKPGRAATLAQLYVTDEIFFCLAPCPSIIPRDTKFSRRRRPGSWRTGDMIDLGDRHFEVLHLPGHSPGSIGLWEAASGILFSGDAVYDGPLIDDCYHSVVEDYLPPMERLRRLPARVIHGGHFGSFDGKRYLALIDDYISGKRRPGCPSESSL